MHTHTKKPAERARLQPVDLHMPAPVQEDTCPPLLSSVLFPLVCSRSSSLSTTLSFLGIVRLKRDAATLTIDGASSGTPPLSVITFGSIASHVTFPGSHKALTLIFTEAVLDKKGASANERFVPGSVS